MTHNVFKGIISKSSGAKGIVPSLMTIISQQSIASVAETQNALPSASLSFIFLFQSHLVEGRDQGVIKHLRKRELFGAAGSLCKIKSHWLK